MSSENPHDKLEEKKVKDPQAEEENDESKQADIKFSPEEEAASTHDQQQQQRPS